MPQPPAATERVWFHIILTTYGAWLDGDLRGFRTRHHREHIDGDYKSPPPPEKYQWRRERSETQLRQPTIDLPESLRPILGTAFRTRLEELGADVLCMAVSSQYIHLQTKLPEGSERTWAGLAKKHAWFAMREQGWTKRLWGKRCKAIRIRDRKHQENTYRYILDHANEGAWIWSALNANEHKTIREIDAAPTTELKSAKSHPLQWVGLGGVHSDSVTSAQSPDHAQNRRAWDALVREQQRHTKPARDEDFANPLAAINGDGWLGSSIAGKRVLCLAAGGGRQSALYAAAGAIVTVVDLSPEMLVLDRAVARERSLNIRAIEASMDDLSMLSSSEFDIVVQPVSTCYVPDIARVYREVARVLAGGGLYISQHKQPSSLQADIRPATRGYELTELYYRAGPLPAVVGSQHREPGTLEYLHRWEELIGALCRAGFVIEDLLEPLHARRDSEPGSFAHRSQFAPPYVRIKARRVGAPNGDDSKRMLWTP